MDEGQVGVERVWPTTGAVEQRAAAAVWKTGGQSLQEFSERVTFLQHVGSRES